MENNRNTENVHDYLPMIPQAVDGVTQCTQILTDRQDNSWKFLFGEIEDIPTAFEDNQDYDFNRIDAEKWQDVIVPSELCTQGFNIENNVEYYYRRIVNIPQDYCKNRVFLRFEGVYSNARVWINNKFCASHIGGFTPWDVEITDFADCGKISLTVGVADMEGDRKSPWNPDGGYNAMASNDFKTKRLNIRSYRATAENGDSLLVCTDCGHINAYADPFKENLQISKGSHTPSIAWGNYWGKRFWLNRKNPFAFSLGFSAKDKEK